MNSPAKNFLARAFPVPKSLLLTDTAVSICGGRLCFFQMEYKRGKYKPKASGRSPFPLSSIEDISPEVRAEAIAAIGKFSRAKKLNLAKCVIHEESAYVFRATLPTVIESQMGPAIESILEENVPISPAEAVFEYGIVSVDRVRGETTVGVTAVSEKTISAHAELLFGGGILTAAFETEARALAMAIFKKGERGVSLVLAIINGHVIIFIAENGVVVFSSTKDSWPGASALQAELTKVAVFWKAKEKKVRDFRDISRVIVLGGRHFSEIAGLVSSSLKLPVEQGSVWTNVLSVEENLPDLSQEESFDFGHLIGALI